MYGLHPFGRYTSGSQRPYSSAMELHGWAFSLAGQIDADRDAAGAPATYTAWERFSNPKGLALNKWGAGPFVRLRPPSLPKAPGVYVITEGEDVLYVGIASGSLFTRWGRGGYSVIDPRNCFTGGQSTNCHLNHLIGDALTTGRTLDLWFLTDPAPRQIELPLIRGLRPPWNIQDR